jgi:hypothetical protein
MTSPPFAPWIRPHPFHIIANPKKTRPLLIRWLSAIIEVRLQRMSTTDAHWRERMDSTQDIYE